MVVRYLVRPRTSFSGAALPRSLVRVPSGRLTDPLLVHHDLASSKSAGERVLLWRVGEPIDSEDVMPPAPACH
jgi:hypothetical protein